MEILKVKNLKTYFFTEKGIGKAVDNISFNLNKGEILAIVGESGCGKSVTAFSILRLIQYPGKIVAGEINFCNKNLLKFTEKDIKKIRGNKIGMIFQDPMNSLNPVFTVGEQIVETILTHKNISRKEAKDLALYTFNRVKLDNSKAIYDSYPHQLSGGMKQRVMIAIALSCNPLILIADEPTTALDVSIQNEILNLLMEIKENEGLSIIFITHDFRVVKEIADTVIVMYAGNIVEKREKENIFNNPLHPYTRALLKSLPPIDNPPEKLPVIKGVVPDIFSFNNGCRFYDRCSFSIDKCKYTHPEKVNLNKKEYLYCFNYL